MIIFDVGHLAESLHHLCIALEAQPPLTGWAQPVPAKCGRTPGRSATIRAVFHRQKTGAILHSISPPLLADQKQPLCHLGRGRFFLPPNFFYFLTALDRAALLCYNSHGEIPHLSFHFAGSSAPTPPRLFLYFSIFCAGNQG